MSSPTTFLYEFRRRGFSNTSRNGGYVPTLNTNHVRPPRKIVNRQSHFYELQQETRKRAKKNKRRARNRTIAPGKFESTNSRKLAWG